MSAEPTEAAPDDLAQQIGIEIDRALTRKKLSVSEVHRRTGISRTVLQGYKTGRFKPGARELYLLCKVLDVSPNRLLLGRDDLRAADPLEAWIGPVDHAANTAKLAVVFKLLSREEQRAILAVVSLMAESRIGGKEQLRQALAAVDAVLAEAPEFLNSIEKQLPPEMVERVANSAAKKSKSGTKAARKLPGEG